MKHIGLILIGIVFLAQMVWAQTENDPAQIGVSARQLGMGKCYVGMADDSAAVFLNPAGLSQIDSLQVGSMTGRHLDTFDYIVLDVAWPTKMGALGVGYSSRSFASPTTSESFGTSNLVLSLASKEDFLVKRLSAGLNLKLYSASLYKINEVDLSASGREIDLGLFYRVSPGFRLGFVQRNLLPSSAGGKLVWSDNEEEGYSTVSKMGLALNLLGQEGVRKSPQELILGLNYEFSPTGGTTPLWHLGLEWKPNKLFSARAGLDGSDLAYGVGLNLFGFGFDYAYHSYSDISLLASHYFSLSLTPPETRAKDLIEVMSPQPGSMLYAKEIEVKGKLNLSVDKLLIDGEEALISRDNQFVKKAVLKLGKNSISIEAFNKKGKLLAKKDLRLLRLMHYKDVAEDYWAKQSIGFLSALGIVSGFPDGTFRPEAKVKRAELAVMLSKIDKEDSDEETRLEMTGFSDVSPKHWAAPFITKAVVKGIITGYPDGTFRPAKSINRAEGVTVVARFDKLLPVVVHEAPFSDVPGRHWAAKSITAVKQAGMLSYLKDKPFMPKNSLTRGEAAEILSKTKVVRGKIDDILSFLKGETPPKLKDAPGSDKLE